jgi:tripartite-type tricarboxylate transporter receptor subunit TctC
MTRQRRVCNVDGRHLQKMIMLDQHHQQWRPSNMNPALRKLANRLCTAAASALLASTSTVASAQGDYPNRPLTLVVGFAPGGPNDILGRHLAKALAQRLGQPVQVFNQAGGSGNPASAAVARAAPDGYTLLLIGPANAINVSLYPKQPFDIRHDIVPVAGITREALVMVVHPSVPARSAAEFIAQANSGARLVMASTGNGSSPHVSGLLFNRMAGIELPIVHFNGGGPALADMVAGGKTQMMFEPISAAIEPVRAGKLRALGVSTAHVSPALPGVPAIAATLPGFEASAVTGIGVPKGTPQAIVERLNREVNAIMADPQLRTFFTDSGGEPLAGSPAEFAKLVFGEIDKWAAVIQAAGVKADDSVPAPSYPQKEITLIVPFPTGGVTDINARILATHLSRLWRQPVTVLNMPGAGGTTGTLYLLAAPKDGYTMMMNATGQATQNPAIDSKLPYQWDEPTLVARTSVSPLVFVVKGDSRWNSLQQLLDDVRKEPAAYKYGTSGPGGVGSIAISLLFGANGVDPRQLGRVTLQGGAPLLDAVITGKTDFAAQYLAEMGPLLQSRQLKALAVSTPTRVKQLPDTPTAKQAGSDSFALIGWNGIAGPADLPADIVAKWNAAIRTLAADAEFVKETEASGAAVAYLGTKDFKDALRQEYETAVVQVQKLGLRR